MILIYQLNKFYILDALIIGERVKRAKLKKSLLLDVIKEGPETVAAFFGEPVMGAGGLIVPPKTYWKKIQEVCKKYDILIVADEVINGFGRTG